MGYVRPRPARLGEKLAQIRTALGLSLSQMLKRLDAEDLIASSQISQYESGTREPPLQLLLRYAHAAGVHVEDIIDDELELPEKLPGRVRYVGIKRNSITRSKKR
ncbi:MAG TPA: helix-turn-helix transcriptional regulator [Pyrinomonadaceae bacterium]|jgi:transcriptional regulator with XRE-family HTH domain|nr:helix-turn-helix transcriptional regulator [Pyrinomonadaceae bacterium]